MNKFNLKGKWIVFKSEEEAREFKEVLPCIEEGITAMKGSSWEGGGLISDGQTYEQCPPYEVIKNDPDYISFEEATCIDPIKQKDWDELRSEKERILEIENKKYIEALDKFNKKYQLRTKKLVIETEEEYTELYEKCIKVFSGENNPLKALDEWTTFPLVLYNRNGSEGDFRLYSTTEENLDYEDRETLKYKETKSFRDKWAELKIK